ncbi:hypothetical protein LWI28_016722 [Acer negundo]|uniref:Endonuclease/exonuclease/phosphatase domain-containing protein n=1 Tax=Acer negundo TaxID=4023 RepID=A0AAD5JTG7_ACENE|nr:hypothetical protein LWI28_016722 [Acer negundo]
MLILPWNVKGLGKWEKRRVVRHLVESVKPSILFLQETKLKQCNCKLISSVGGFCLLNGVAVNASGSSGGLLSLWNADLFKVIKEPAVTLWPEGVGSSSGDANLGGHGATTGSMEEQIPPNLLP